MAKVFYLVESSMAVELKREENIIEDEKRRWTNIIIDYCVLAWHDRYLLYRVFCPLQGPFPAEFTARICVYKNNKWLIGHHAKFVV